MSAPRISVIIPTLNSANTLPACLDSLVSQDHRDFEVLVVDGRSTDSTVDILETYRRRCPRLTFTSEKDLGLYDAMNKGAARAHGEWLYFLGSDDRLYGPDVLARLFHEPVPSRVGLLYGNVRFDGTSRLANDGDLYAGRFTVEKLLETNVCQQAIFYRRRCFEKHGPHNLAFPIFADWELNFRFFSRVKTLYRDLVVAWYSARGISARRPFEDAFLENRYQRWKRYFPWHFLAWKIRQKATAATRRLRGSTSASGRTGQPR